MKAPQPFRRATRAVPAGSWPAAEAVDSVTLAFDDRQRRRVRLVGDGGTEVLLDLPRVTTLGHGDGLALEEGGWIAVRAAPEPVLEVTAPTPHDLLRLAWHLGNRHTPAEILPDRIRIRADHVLRGMLEGQGARVRETQAPFSPEGGAYHAQGSGQGGGHGHG